MIIEALYSLHPDWKAEGIQPVVRDLINHMPICEDQSRAYYIELSALDKEIMQWSGQVFSVEKDAAVEKPQIHANTRVSMRSSTDPAYVQEFTQIERLISHTRCQEILDLSLDKDGVESLQGRQVYRAFSPVVDYSDIYRGVRYVVGRGGECAGRVQLDRQHRRADTWLDVPLSDSFSQVGGLWVNAMTDVPSGEMYIANGCELSMRSPKHTVARRTETDVWYVYARHLPQGDKIFVTDLFVFDATTRQLVEVMLGVQYRRVAKASISKMLAQMTKDESALRIKASSAAPRDSAPPAALPAATNTTTVVAEPKPTKKKDSTKTKSGKTAPSPVSGRRDITDEVRNLVVSVSGILAEEIELDADMADFGIDSLMGIELAREVEKAFKCTLDEVEQMEATTVRKFVLCVGHALFGADAIVPLAESAGDDDDDEDSSDEGSESSSLVIVETDYNSATTTWSQSEPSLVKTPTPSQTSLPVKHLQPTNVTIAQALPPAHRNLALSLSDVLESFGEVKIGTDDLLREYQIDDTEKIILAGSNRLCAALVVEAFDELGSPLCPSMTA